MKHSEKNPQYPVIRFSGKVIFPHCIASFFLPPDEAQKIEQALKTNEKALIGVMPASQKQEYKIGILCRIINHRFLPDGRIRVMLQGQKRVQLKYIKGNWGSNFTREPDERKEHLKSEALLKSFREILPDLVDDTDLMLELETVSQPSRFSDLLAGGIELSEEEQSLLLGEFVPLKRLDILHQIVIRRLEVKKAKEALQNRVRAKISKAEREIFLREQLKAIKGELAELTGSSGEEESLRRKIDLSGMPTNAQREAIEVLDRLSTMHADLAEASVLKSYLEFLCALPWNKSDSETIEIDRAQKTLDENHFGLENVKNRILEFMAVRKLSGKSPSGILCFVGPPGVGKTSLARSIANALSRKFVRISLGGVTDEAEIRGHRRTYVGAMPGKIIQALKQAGTNNPVVLLDEIDKISGHGHSGIAGALLEVLDPEQNTNFLDNYVNLPFDLSRVLFIATANIADTIPPVLRDRFELIELAGYTSYEKTNIAEQFLIPRAIVDNGLMRHKVSIPRASLEMLIQEYTHEAGIRELQRKLDSLCRKEALRAVALDSKKLSKNYTVQEIRKSLGVPPYPLKRAVKGERLPVGMVQGLARTPAGGETIYIEAEFLPREGEILLTGSLGEIMRESARLALSYIFANATKYGINVHKHLNQGVHIHIPEGAVSKDGPSGGAAIVIALFSLFSGKRLPADFAVTGEITLKGNVIAVGGVRDKLLAAQRYSIGKIIMPEANKSEIIQLDSELKKKIHIFYVSDIDELIRISFNNR